MVPRNSKFYGSFGVFGPTFYLIDQTRLMGSFYLKRIFLRDLIDDKHISEGFFWRPFSTISYYFRK